MKKWLQSHVPASVYDFSRKKYNDIKGYFKHGKTYKSRRGQIGVYLINAPEYLNLGDQAIAQAEIELLRGQYQIYEIPSKRFAEHVGALRTYLNPDDLLAINGGGYMGVEWFGYEESIRRVITEFPRNRVIIFPQTIFYGDSERGLTELERSKEIYSAHPDLHIFAREKTSYELMKQSYPRNYVYMAPDMVLSMNRSLPRLPRDGILFCMREDPEKKLTDREICEMESLARVFDPAVRFTDTALKGRKDITPDERDKAISQKLDEIKSSRLLLTDRLHGMVFAAITGTPCVAFGNYNHKIKGVYEWISDLDYIVYKDGTEGLADDMRRLLSLTPEDYDEKRLSPYFDELRSVFRL